MPRKYNRRTPSAAPGLPAADAFSAAIAASMTPMVHAIVDARIADFMVSWLLAHAPDRLSVAPQSAPEALQSTPTITPEVPQSTPEIAPAKPIEITPEVISGGANGATKGQKNGQSSPRPL